MKAYTDYPFESLGDAPSERAPIREIKVISYDGNKYCSILVEGKMENIKGGYIYKRRGYCGDIPSLSKKLLRQLELKKDKI